MRELTRTISRRIGKYVVTLSPAGIQVRQYRKRQATTPRVVSYQDLAEMAGTVVATTRGDAFSYQNHPGWQPAIGDVVWLSKRVTKYSRGRVANIIGGVPQCVFVVTPLRGKSNVLADVKDMRPAPAFQDKTDRPLLEAAP